MGDFNGQLVLNFMTGQNMILINDAGKCTGTVTWRRRSQENTIDFLLMNNAVYNIRFCRRMQIDENQEKLDISDHNLIEWSSLKWKLTMSIIKERENETT